MITWWKGLTYPSCGKINFFFHEKGKKWQPTQRFSCPHMFFLFLFIYLLSWPSNQIAGPLCYFSPVQLPTLLHKYLIGWIVQQCCSLNGCIRWHKRCGDRCDVFEQCFILNEYSSSWHGYSSSWYGYNVHDMDTMFMTWIQ